MRHGYFLIDISKVEKTWVISRTQLVEISLVAFGVEFIILIMFMQFLTEQGDLAGHENAIDRRREISSFCFSAGSGKSC
jgi:hypothetical protein